VGTSGTSYASQLVDFLDEVKSRLESAVPLTSILVSLLDMANNAVANLQYASFYEQDDIPDSPVGSLQNYLGDLWWVSNAGAAQLTSGSGLNAAALGGINGDYGGANPASLYFSDADSTYYFYDDYGTSTWAWFGGRGVYLYGDADSTTRVKLTAATGTANYTVTFADALPAAQTMVQIQSDGDLVYSNTLPSDTSITLSGSQSLGKIKHGTYTMYVPVTAGNIPGTPGDNFPSPGIFTASTIYIPVPGLPANTTLKGFGLYLSAVPGAAVTYTAVVVNSGNGTWISTGITVTSSGQTPSATGSSTLHGSAGPLYIKVEATSPTTIDSLFIQYSSE
jgi:hypothetical protein